MVGERNVMRADLDPLSDTASFADPEGRSQETLITADALGSRDFRKEYRVKYAYLAGAMYKGIASKELVVAMGISSDGCSLVPMYRVKKVLSWRSLCRTRPDQICGLYSPALEIFPAFPAGCRLLESLRAS